MRKITITKHNDENGVHTFIFDGSEEEQEAVLVDAIGSALQLFNNAKYKTMAEWVVGRRYMLADECEKDKDGRYRPAEGHLIPIRRLRKYVVSYAHLVTLLRGEHHYAMKLGLPLDAKIIDHDSGNDRARGVEIIVESKEFDEVESVKDCKEYGNLSLEVLPCMPILSAEVHTN